jgi:hypothetical protein
MTKVTELVVQYQRTGDQRLVAQIIDSVIPFVHCIINETAAQIKTGKHSKGWYFTDSAREELVDECLTIILTRCLQQFDPARGKEFLTHFGTGIRGLTLNHIKFHNRQKRKGESKTLPFSYEIDDEGNTLDCLLTDESPGPREVAPPNIFFADLLNTVDDQSYQVALGLYNGETQRDLRERLGMTRHEMNCTIDKLRSLPLTQELF